MLHRTHRIAALALAVAWTSACASTASESLDSRAPEVVAAASVETKEPAASDAAIATDEAPAEPEPAPDPEPEPASDHRDGVLEPLDAELATLFMSGDEDPAGKFKQSYIVSNEERHDLMLPYIAGLGGAYVGVGSDQNYTLMAAAKAEFAFLVDLDRQVTDVHRFYQVLIPLAETPEALREMFATEQAEATLNLLEQAWSDLPERERKRRLKRWKITRDRMRRNMNEVRRRKVDKARTPTWMNDQAMYDHVRTMFVQGRVRAMSGDLTGATSMQTIGSVAEQIGVPVTVLYMSNAEEYFDYTDQFAANIRALPHVEESIVLRTLRIYGWVKIDDWHYQMQSLPDMATRMGDGHPNSRERMLRQAKDDGALARKTGPVGTSVIGLEVR